MMIYETPTKFYDKLCVVQKNVGSQDGVMKISVEQGELERLEI